MALEQSQLQVDRMDVAKSLTKTERSTYNAQWKWVADNSKVLTDLIGRGSAEFIVAVDLKDVAHRMTRQTFMKCLTHAQQRQVAERSFEHAALYDLQIIFFVKGGHFYLAKRHVRT